MSRGKGVYFSTGGVYGPPDERSSDKARAPLGELLGS